MPSVTDLLRRSAPLAQQLADSLCTTRNGNDDCGALHGVWPALRLLQLGADPTRHADFFEAAIGLLAPVSERVLISGCADWGMLDTAASIYRRRAAAMRATALDQCVTPLLLCAWYGAQTQVPVRTVCADASAFDEYAAFDMIATHSLLTYRDLAGRRELVANWHRLLAPGGAVITVTRLQPMAPADVAAASAAERGGGPGRFRMAIRQRAVVCACRTFRTRADIASRGRRGRCARAVRSGGIRCRAPRCEAHRRWRRRYGTGLRSGAQRQLRGDRGGETMNDGELRAVPRELHALIAANARLWAGEAEIFSTYFASSQRSAATDAAWLARQCYKELIDGVVARVVRLTQPVQFDLAPAIASRALADSVARQELTHYIAFATAYAACVDASRRLDGSRIGADWPENAALQRLRAQHCAAHGALGVRAQTFTEGGYCTLYRAGMALRGGSAIDDAIAAACTMVFDDEWDHMLHGIADLTDTSFTPDDWRVLEALTVAQGQLRIHMRNAQFGYPVSAARMAALQAGAAQPLTFDYARAGMQPPN
jgi:SAM-dependent methyltransferase